MAAEEDLSSDEEHVPHQGIFRGQGADMSSKDDLAAEGALADAAADDASDRRNFDRYDVEWSVDCVASDTFLFASITNISEMGIFVRTVEPLRTGTKLRLTFAPPGVESFQLEGTVAWVNPLRPDGDNPNPGMGIKFV